MMDLAFITPHSPLLSTRISKKASLPPKTNEAFDGITEVLREKNIKHLVTLGSYPKYDRMFFSAYAADTHSLDFSAFGDLVTAIDMKPWFQGLHAVRESIINPPLELLSDQKVDYTHGIPLMHLSSRFQGPEQLSILPINDWLSATNDQRRAFGQNLATALNKLDTPYAVMCSGDLYATMEQTHSKQIHQENKRIKLEIEQHFSFSLSSQLEDNTAIKSPTLSHTLPILSGMFQEATPNVDEISYETVNQTSFYFARINS